MLLEQNDFVCITLHLKSEIFYSDVQLLLVESI